MEGEKKENEPRGTMYDDVYPKIERLMCDCGGECVYLGICHPVYPPRYVHFCCGCGATSAVGVVYPRIIFKQKYHPTNNQKFSDKVMDKLNEYAKNNACDIKILLVNIRSSLNNP